MGFWNRKKDQSEQDNDTRDDSITSPEVHTNPTGPASLVDLTRMWMEGDGWHPEQHSSREDTLASGFNGDNGSFRVYVQVREELKQFFAYVLYPDNVPEDLRQRVADFITRANYGMRIGNFEMDFDDGEVRYKSSFDFENERLTGNLIKNALYPAATTLDRYAPGLKAIVEERVTAKEAIAMIEDGDSSSADSSGTSAGGTFDPTA